MTWTATKLPATFENGIFIQNVVYTDGVSQKFTVDYRSTNTHDDWPDSEVRSRLDILNSADVSKISTGAIKSAPAAIIAPPVIPATKTQAQIDQDQFWVDYNKERTDQILKTLTPELAARYKPEYGSLK